MNIKQFQRIIIAFTLTLTLVLPSLPVQAQIPAQIPDQTPAQIPDQSPNQSPNQDVPQITYGFVRDSSDPQRVTAIAYPNTTSDNVTMTTAQFTLLLPEGTATEPAVPVAPETGSFTDITGIWQILKLTPSVWSAASENINDLEGFDLYQVTLQNSPEVVSHEEGRIPLFSFRLAEPCGETSGRVLTNDENIQQEVLALFGNVNNQMSMSIDDAPAADIYADNNGEATSICSSPLVDDSSENTSTGGDTGAPAPSDTGNSDTGNGDTGNSDTGDSKVYLPVVMR